ncbi:protein MTSS 1-like isoform X2 [Scleropages formosus]|uniref:MTSS I-BAR domain containing 1 n=1 Tax=Scleropages formosus TaxID=113540 RepID=A0A8C9QZ38_SCLFO|nr:protein MTSS 1-like isoform X2 [Scleropages formosus]
MEAVMEKECSALGALFHTVIGDMKSSYPVWEDFISKAGKLQSQLRGMVAAAAAFLDAFQKVADLATSTRGGTRDIGSALTRMCMRHRSIEARLRQLSSVFIDSLINPLQEQMEEWKKGVNTLDKDHAKDYKKARQEIKKRSLDTLKLQKKAKKGKGDLQPRLDNALQDVSDKYILLEETEKQALRRALIEERGRFCTFVSMLRPVVDEEISMLGEITHLQTIADDLKALTMDPHKLPPASEQVILDLKGSDYNWSYQTPPSSPSTNASRKSSMCSSLNSVHSSDSRSSGSRSRSPSSHCRYRSCTLPPQPTGRLSSVSSHDSGFISQDAFQSKSPSPMPLEITAQLSNGCNQYGPFNPPQLPGMGTVKPLLHFPAQSCSSSCSSSTSSLAWSRPCPALLPAYSPYCTLGPDMVPSSKVPTWKDWARPGPYDQPVANTLKKRKDHDQEARNNVSVPQSEGIITSRNATCSNPISSTNKQVEDMEAHEELALALAQGLPLDPQCSSRDSLQGSSGYSTQSTTPCCSEDAIHTPSLVTPEPVSDYDYFCIRGDEEHDQQDFEKSSTVPRGSDFGHLFHRVLQAQRPASTASSVIVTPGVATIRRTPSTKPSVRRVPGGGGPIPIKTAVVPVRTPTVPDLPGGYVLGVGGVVPPNPESFVKSPQWDEQLSEGPDTPLEEGDSVHTNGEDMLLTIRRGVRLKKTMTNDRSAPRIA